MTAGPAYWFVCIGLAALVYVLAIQLRANTNQAQGNIPPMLALATFLFPPLGIGYYLYLVVKSRRD